MEGKQTKISDAVLIEIVHGIKDIIIELINHAFLVRDVWKKGVMLNEKERKTYWTDDRP